MTLAQAIVLGAVQGATEFLPISSSAHLILAPWLMGWPDQGLTFDVVLHAGTLIAILSFFWKDWFQMVAGVFQRDRHNRSPQPAMLWLIICGTVPAAIVGFLAEKTIETTLRSPFILSITLIGVALLLWLAERIVQLNKDLSQVSLTDALSIGGAQALALVPGTSRSGITIATGLFRGLTREAAARFSFLLSAPITGGSVLKRLLDLQQAGIAEAERIPMLFGFLSSLIVGYLTIKFLMRYLQRNTLQVFIVYRIVLGVVILLLIQFAGFRP
ncbi:MAG: undecaprenyl-diphosphatase UppP [Acidobacteria bacterium]|nr:undecaprenyl-diphosphatase UppP [Acidobacteriota bacterium]MCI0623108.1 undecaprenyl-diphosphatase UppP [Acidobacteriota bacterium]MCI0720831.1 undecaprenyl-diphosphatase UppP [Acidobacteriota bacterium]